MRRALVIAAVSLLAFVVVCGALLAFVLTTGEPRLLTNAALEWALTAAVGNETKLGDSRGSLVRGLTLNDLEVGSEDGERLAIRRARLELDPWALLDGRVEIRLLRLVGLTIEGVQRSDGSWSWAGGVLAAATEERAPEQEAAAAGPRSVSLRALVLEEVRVRLEWPATDGPARLGARLDARLSDFVWPPADEDEWLPPFEARLTELEIEGGRFPVAAGDLSAEHRSGEVSLSTTGIRAEWGRIDRAEVRTRIEGGIDAPRIERGHAEASFSQLDPGALLEGSWPASSISGRTRFDWLKGEVHGDLGLDAFTIFGLAVDGADAQGRVWLDGGEIQFEVASLQARAAAGRIDGSVAGDAARARQLELEVQDVDLSALPEAWLGPDWRSGRITAEASLAGPWDALEGDFDLRAREIRHPVLGRASVAARGRLLGFERLRLGALDVDAAEGVVPSFTSLQTFELGFANGRLAVADAKLRVAGGALALDGSLSGDRFSALEIRADAIDLGALLEGAGVTGVGGVVSADLIADGLFTRPAFEGWIDWQAPHVRGLDADRAKLVLTRRVAGAPARAASGAERRGARDDRQGLQIELEADASIALQADASFSTVGLLQNPESILDDPSLRLDLSAQGLDARTLALRSVPDEQLPRGTIDARVTAFGPLREPLLEGRVDWADAGWRALSAERISAKIESNDAKGGARFDLNVWQEGRESVHAVVSVSDRRLLMRPRELVQDPGASIDLVFDAFDFSTLDAALEDGGVFVRGIADGRVRVVAGDVPNATGEIRIAGLTATGPVLPFDVGPTPARFVFAGDVVRVSSIELPSADGSALIRLQASWADPSNPQLQLRARADSFAIELPGVIDGRLDGDATVYGTPSALTGEGGLMLHHARIDLPDREDPIFEEIDVQYDRSKEDTLALEEGEGDDLYDALEGRIALTIGESVWLRGVGAELELEGELVARKQRNEPAGLYGNVEVVSGRVDFQGKWLRVTSGSAIFDGNPDPDPYIDATAQHRVSDVTIFARLFGRASALQLELDSEPPMSKEDQISYLLFDRPATGLGSFDQQSVGAMAAIMAGDYILGSMANDIVKEVGIDRVRLGVDENDSPTFEVEKQVHERVTLRYGRGFGTDGGDRFVIEWRLFRELFLSGEQLTNGESGLDVFWRRDY